MTWEVVEGDVRAVLRTMPDRSFDGCLSDPPYGLSFMGRRWDYNVPSSNVWAELLRVLRPGANAVIFGGSRTFHRLAVAVEDGGLEICDLLMWLYGSGYPKSLDIAKAIDKRAGHWRGRAGKPTSGDDKRSFGQHYEPADKGDPVTTDVRRWSGYGTNLKPAYEPALLARRPCEGTFAENAIENGCGGLAIDASRIGDEVLFNPGHAVDFGTALQRRSGEDVEVRKSDYAGQTVVGRWPANIVVSHAVGCRLIGRRARSRPALKKTDAAIDRADPNRKSATWDGGKLNASPEIVGTISGEEDVYDCASDCPLRLIDEQSGGCSGGASRYFYCAKANRRERDRGLDNYEGVAKGVGALRDSGRSDGMAKNDHPTVKPLDLVRYFARLILPPPRKDGRPRRIVVPFSGSGSEMIGCLQAGWDEVVGIEREPGYAEKARDRIRKGRIVTNAR